MRWVWQNNNERAKEIPSGKDAALIAQLRSGHSLKPADYRFRIGKDTLDLCLHCQEVAEDIQHWIWEVGSPLGALMNNIGRVLEFTAKTFKALNRDMLTPDPYKQQQQQQWRHSRLGAKGGFWLPFTFGLRTLFNELLISLNYSFSTNLLQDGSLAMM